MNECVFCRIVAGDSPASVVYEDDVVMAFLDLRPLNPGHTLVIPKRHAASLAELDEETGRQMWAVAQRTTAALRRSGVRCEGVSLRLSDGEAAGQEIPHVHLHVIPRYRGEPVKAGPSPLPTRDDLDRVAVQIRTAYEQLGARDPYA